MRTSKQYYADYHMHSEFSVDSKELLGNYVKEAEKQGISEFCITDHWDLEPQTTHADLNGMRKGMDRWATENANAPAGIRVNFGIEVGDGYLNVPLVDQVLAEFPFDYVIGSVHSLNSAAKKSIFHGFPDQPDKEAHQRFFRHYFDTMILQSQQTYFDSLGHIIYAFRYMKHDVGLSIQDYMEDVTTILENLIQNQKSFELNTTQGTTLEIWRPILQRYQDLGGTAITLGADAHRASHFGLGIPEGVALLKSYGFQHYLVYRERKPVEIPIL